MNDYHAEASGPSVLTVRFGGVKAGWEQWFLLSSDRHHDNLHCERQIERQHLDKAIEREALIIDAGDCFCAMQGKFDPRSSMDDIRPEDVGADYLDRIVKHAAMDYSPYSAHWLLMGKGNHESNILKRHGVDLTSNLVHRLNSDHGGRVFVGDFDGWIRFLFVDDDGRGRGSKNLYYHHGYGGEAPVTKGVIQTNRQATYLPDADVVLNGHSHNAYWVPIKRIRLSTKGVLSSDIQHFIRTPGYKLPAAWEIEKGMQPKPIGCIWMRITAHRRRNGKRVNDLAIDLTFEQAVI